jgi:phosphomannomutase
MNEYSSKKIIIFDLDDTLSESKTSIDQEMVRFLNALLDKKKVAIISGGALRQINLQVSNHLDCSKLENLYILPGNGSSLYSYDESKAEWKPSYEALLNENEKKEIVEAYDASIKELKFEKPQKLYGNVMDDRGGQITFSELGQQAPLDEKKRWDPDQKKRLSIVEKMESKLAHFSIKIGGMTSIDVTKKNVDKAHGAQNLLTFLKLEKKDALYIGDAIYPQGNDYSMKEAHYDCIKVNNPEDTKRVIETLLS